MTDSDHPSVTAARSEHTEPPDGVGVTRFEPPPGLYVVNAPEQPRQMTKATTAVQRTTTYALHQATVLFGILTLPLALLARRAGVVLPVGRLVEWANSVYDHHTD